jgi:hypothetical protein
VGSLPTAGLVWAMRVYMELHETGMRADVYSGVYPNRGRTLYANLLGCPETNTVSDMSSNAFGKDQSLLHSYAIKSQAVNRSSRVKRLLRRGHCD